MWPFVAYAYKWYIPKENFYHSHSTSDWRKVLSFQVADVLICRQVQQGCHPTPFYIFHTCPQPIPSQLLKGKHTVIYLSTAHGIVRGWFAGGWMEDGWRVPPSTWKTHVNCHCNGYALHNLFPQTAHTNTIHWESVLCVCSISHIRGCHPENTYTHATLITAQQHCLSVSPNGCLVALSRE